MSRHIVTFASAFLFVLPGLVAHAQRQPIPSGVSGDFNVYDDLVAQADRHVAMSEDMEVMRRILDESLEGVYQHRGSKALVLGDSGGGRAVSLKSLEEVLRRKSPGNQIPDALAAYLDGHGVVYQLTAPPLHEEPKRKKPESEAVAKAPTRWEATRQRLSANPDAPLATTRDYSEGVSPLQFGIGFPNALPTKSVLVERLLDVLAENGHNFRHLEPEERLTVACTFVESKELSVVPTQPCGRQTPYGMGGGRAADFDGGMPGSSDGFGSMGMGGEDPEDGMEVSDMMSSGGTMGEGDMGGGSGGMDMGMGTGAGMDAMGGMAEMYGGSATPRWSFGYSGEFTTGDLHLRQGNCEKAVESYEKAIRKVIQTDPYKHKPSGKQVFMYQKLIQALVGVRRYTQAQQLMETIKSAQEEAPSSEKPGRHFPARLVVSATKAQLDQVAAGKMTRQEFDKQATTDYWGPHSVKAEQDDAAVQSPPATLNVR